MQQWFFQYTTPFILSLLSTVVNNMNFGAECQIHHILVVIG